MSSSDRVFASFSSDSGANWILSRNCMRPIEKDRNFSMFVGMTLMRPCSFLAALMMKCSSYPTRLWKITGHFHRRESMPYWMLHLLCAAPRKRPGNIELEREL